MSFWQKLWLFLKEVAIFGVEVFIMAISREVGRRFWNRLKERGEAIGVLEPPDEEKKQLPSAPVRVQSGSSLPFLDEYRD